MRWGSCSWPVAHGRSRQFFSGGGTAGVQLDRRGDMAAHSASASPKTPASSTPDEQQDRLYFGGIDVFAARDDEIVTAIEHIQ